MQINPFWRDDQQLVEFTLPLDGRLVICTITDQALYEQFGASGGDDVGVLMRNLEKVAPVAERLARQLPPGTPIRIEAADFHR